MGLAKQPKVTVIQRKCLVVLECPDLTELNTTIRRMITEGGWHVEHSAKFEPYSNNWHAVLSRPEDPVFDLFTREGGQ